jgi:hypothetical protein
LALLFVGNTHTKIIRFQMVNGVFWTQVVLTLTDFVRVMAMPDPGWETTDQLQAASLLVSRLAFFCADALKGQSRRFRLFSAAIFILATLNLILQAYFVNAAITIYTINATNTTFTTSEVQASVGTTQFSLALNMLVTIWHDKEFKYCSLCTSFLPKHVLDTINCDPQSAAYQSESAAAAAESWQGRPGKAEGVALMSLFVYIASHGVEASPLELGTDGRESALLVALRVVAVSLQIGGSASFFLNNISWPRLYYTLTCPQGCLWVMFSCMYLVVGVANPAPETVTSSLLSVTYAFMGFMLWLCLESVKRISRQMRAIVTIFAALTCVSSAPLSAFVWSYDPILVDLNGVHTRGTLRKYSLWRTCFTNLGLLMAGSLYTMVFDWEEGKYMVLVTGSVLRQKVLKLKSLMDPVVGDSEAEIDAANTMQN